MNKGEFVFVINHSGERVAGILPFSDTVTIQVASGDPGGDDGEFEEFMRGTLQEWYDVAVVYTNKEYQEMLQADHDSFCYGSVD